MSSQSPPPAPEHPRVSGAVVASVAIVVVLLLGAAIAWFVIANRPESR